MTKRMIFRSDPRTPGAIALLGDYAVQQNARDRSNPTLNTLMDEKLKPRHDTWTTLWVTQQQREDALAAVLRRRDDADEGLLQATKRVLNALELNLGDDSPAIQQYIPDANLGVTRLPLYRELTTLEPYARNIAQATDAIIPAEVRAQFATALETAKTTLSEAETAEKSMIEAQRSRAEADPAWLEAYTDYHRAVEYVAGGDRRLISTWILSWPSTPVKSTDDAAGSSASTSGDTAPAGTPSTDGSGSTTP